jgi:hypothetical protein
MCKKNKETVYISGKITGLKDYRKRFKEVEDKLTAEGYLCMNPAILPEGFPYKAYISISIAMLEQCDTIYMMDNWKDSEGAKFELMCAKLLGKKIMYERGDK